MIKNLNKMIKTLITSSYFLYLLLPIIASSQTQSLPSAPIATTSGGSGDLSFKLVNFVKVDSITDLFVSILNVIIVIATPIVVIFIIFAGFKYVTAQGNPAKIQDATRALTYAIIGGVLIIGAVAIATIIGNLVGAFAA